MPVTRVNNIFPDPTVDDPYTKDGKKNLKEIIFA